MQEALNCWLPQKVRQSDQISPTYRSNSAQTKLQHLATTGVNAIEATRKSAAHNDEQHRLRAIVAIYKERSHVPELNVLLAPHLQLWLL